MAIATDTMREALSTAYGGAARWVSIHAADPGSTGASEASGGSPAYARKQTTWTPGAVDGANTGSQVTIDVPAGVYAYVGLWTTVTGGVYRDSAAIPGGPITVIGQSTFLVTPMVAIEAATQPANGPLEYGRYSFVVDTTHTITEQATRWPWTWLQGDLVSEGHLIKAVNPAAHVMVYAGSHTWRSYDTTMSVGSALAWSNPSWFLKDSGGVNVRRSVWGTDDWALDPGNTAYQTAAAAFLIAKCQNDAWDGVVLDDLNAGFAWGQWDRVPAQYPDDTTWQAGLTAFVSYVAGHLQAAGFKVWGNIGAQTVPFAQAITPYLDGTSVESWVIANKTTVKTIQSGEWQGELDWVIWSEANAAQPVFHATVVDPGLADFALGTCLLGTQGKGIFSATGDPWVNEEVWTPAMVTARTLGSATAEYVADASGIRWRQFKNGRVLVNPTTSSHTFDGHTLPATSALLTADAAPSLAVETWTGSNGAAWPAQWTTAANGGTVTIQSNQGRMVNVTGGWNPGPNAYLSGMTAVLNSDTTVFFTLGSLPAVEQYVRVSARADGTWLADAPGHGYSLLLQPPDIVSLYRADVELVVETAGFTVAAGTVIGLRLQVSSAVVNGKAWNAAGAEPGTWSVTYTDGTPYNTAGKCGLSTSNGATGEALVYLWDNLQIVW